MNYSDNPNSVRVDFFKPSGKWYATEAITWLDYTGDIHATFQRSLRESTGTRYKGMTAVCLEPYHENAYPLMIEWDPT